MAVVVVTLVAAVVPLQPLFLLLSLAAAALTVPEAAGPVQGSPGISGVPMITHADCLKCMGGEG